MMSTRLLLPLLPPELRDLVYAQTTVCSNPGTTVIPFTHKLYDKGYTCVEIIPFHHGNPSLLALQSYRYLERKEYAKWVLANAVHLRVTVVFKLHLYTFLQGHWDKKMGVHSRKLVNTYPWLQKAVDYDVKILCRPKESATRKKQRRIGAVAKRMVEVLTQMMDAETSVKRGCVKAVLYVPDWIVGGYRLRRQTLGLGEFVWGVDGEYARTQVREVRVTMEAGNRMNQKIPPDALRRYPRSLGRKG